MLSTLRTLSEDIFVYIDEDIDENRRLDLTGSLNAAVNVIMPILRKFVAEKLMLRRKSMENGDESIIVYEKLVMSALQLLTSLSEWTDYK